MQNNPSTPFLCWREILAVTIRNRGVGLIVGRFPDVREEFFTMKRVLCLLIALSCLASLPGCSSCLGNSCRRASMMEFRNTGRGIYRRDCAPPCDPCQTSPCGGEPCGVTTPCCEGRMEGETIIGPTPTLSEPGTFS